MPEQGGLADPGFPTQDQDPTATVPSVVEQALDHLSLRPPAQQHQSTVGALSDEQRRPRGCAVYGCDVLVGRQGEQARIERLLVEAQRGNSGVLVLRGEPGIGKTTLLRLAVESAVDMTVLSATGVPAEAGLEYSGLLALARPILRFVDDLPEHQAEALREALGLAPPRPRDHFLVGAAVLSLLAAAAETRPVLVVVDDAQWLDHASLDALRFAARRLLADRVAFVFAVRDRDEREFATEGFEELQLHGMGLDEVSTLLAGPAGTVLPSDVVARVRAATSGNPLALIELGTRLTPQQLAEWRIDAEPLPIARRLEHAFSSRLSALPDGTRAALLIVAISTVHDFDAVARALLAADIPVGMLEAAEDHGFISVSDGEVVFSHPLMRSAVYHSASPSQRRRAHRALADSLGEREDLGVRVTHLAGATLVPDEEVASALASVAESAYGRHGHAASAALEQAARLTPDTGTRLERLTLAAEMAWKAGDATRTIRLLDAARPTAIRSDQQARLLHLRGRVERRVGMSPRASELLFDAAALVEHNDPLEAARILSTATVTAFMSGDLPAALRTAFRLRDLVPRDDRYLDSHADETLGWMLCVCGRMREATPLLERALRWQVVAEDPGWAQLCHAAGMLRLLERTRESVVLEERAAQAARHVGPRALLTALELLTRWEVQDGRWALATAHGDEGLTLARSLGHVDQLSIQLVKLAVIDAARGDAPQCRRRLDEARRASEEHGLVVTRIAADGVLGRLEFSLGHVHPAVTVLRTAVAAEERIGMHDRDHAPQPDLIEALVHAGRRDDAVELLARFAETAQGGMPLWGGALVARCRGLLADDASFDSHFQEALDLHSRVEDRFEHARTLLCHGERLRRAGAKVEARDRLREAHSVFDELQAGPWADRAGRELRATGERINRTTRSLDRELTPQELQVLVPVADGKTNKEAAAALFLSPKTVEFHLSSVYRKLGVSSRAELIKRVSAEGLEALVPV